jgi:hypothetical protein
MRRRGDLPWPKPEKGGVITKNMKNKLMASEYWLAK